MAEARKLSDALELGQVTRTQLVGMLDVRCILFLTKKSKEVEQKEYSSLAEIAEVISSSTNTIREMCCSTSLIDLLIQLQLLRLQLQLRLLRLLLRLR